MSIHQGTLFAETASSAPSLIDTAQRHVTFPETKYMGSKQSILPFIFEHVKKLTFSRVLDAFFGSASVAHTFRRLGFEVHPNDFLRFAFKIPHAEIKKNHTR